MRGGQRRCAVLGSPVAHSLSPVVHRAAYAELGLDWQYEAREVDEPALAGFLAALDAPWRGLSLTMPLKRSVLPLLHEVSDLARRAGAVNTVILEEGVRTGHNTDVGGVTDALRERAGPVPLDARATVLGGGATAGSVLLALADLGCVDVDVVVRDRARAQQTLGVARTDPAAPRVRLRGYDELLDGSLDVAHVVVSTIPAQAQTAALLAAVASAEVVFEVRYHPWPTPLAARARERGAVLVSGLDLLVHQAAGQVRLMTGSATAPLASMRAAGEAALARRNRSGPGDV